MTGTTTAELAAPGLVPRTEEARLARQSPAGVVMVRPHHFTPNPQTAADNTFQTEASGLAVGAAGIATAARREVTRAAGALREAGIRVHLFDDRRRDRPDSVFPNNWFTTHDDGRVALYPMHSPNRRSERRAEILEHLGRHYDVREVLDHSPAEQEGVHLEGTGALVLDHVARVAYVALSQRADARLVDRVCAELGYEPVSFTATDADGVPIYHTNVMMSVASRFAMVALESIEDEGERALVRDRLLDSGREVLALTREQLAEFAGNALELRGDRGAVLALSAGAWAALTPAQQDAVARHARPLPLSVPTIELAGGSVRCMLAGIHLPPRSRLRHGRG